MTWGQADLGRGLLSDDVAMRVEDIRMSGL